MNEDNTLKSFTFYTPQLALLTQDPLFCPQASCTLVARVRSSCLFSLHLLHPLLLLDCTLQIQTYNIPLLSFHYKLFKYSACSFFSLLRNSFFFLPVLFSPCTSGLVLSPSLLDVVDVAFILVTSCTAYRS